MNDAPLPRWVVPVLFAGAAGVVAYVSAWALAGAWTDGYDPVAQAISELFAVRSPVAPALLVSGALVLTGVLLVPFAWALHLALPGEGLTGPVLAAVSGVATVLVAFFPCTDGCPGVGTSSTDTAHTVIAGLGYAALVAAPIAFGLRMRGHDDRFATVSIVIGAVAAVGFAARAAGAGTDITGLLQRVFNTLADAWYVLAAFVATRYARREDPSPSR